MKTGVVNAVRCFSKDLESLRGSQKFYRPIFGKLIFEVENF